MPQQLECRVFERHDCEVPASCQPAAANEMRWEATVRDLSRSGLRLVLRRRFEPGSGLAVILPGESADDPNTAFVKVVHAKRQEDGTWSLGCRFLSELNDYEVDRLVGLSRRAVPEEPAAVLPEAAVIPEVRLRITVAPGRVVRCRIKRFQVAGPWPLAAGRTLQLRGEARDGRCLEQVCRVIRCERLAEGWTIQVRLLDPSAAPAWLQTLA